MGFMKNIWKRSVPTKNSLTGTINEKEPLQTNLQENIQKIKKDLGNSDDIVIREVWIGKTRDVKAAIIYTDGLADNTTINEFIMESLMQDAKKSEIDKALSSSQSLVHVLKDVALAVGDVQDITDFQTLYASLLSGDAVILLDGQKQGFSAGTRGWKDMGVTEATNQTTVRGPRESFSESLRTNTSLIRRKIKDPNLWLETRKIGRVTKTNVSIAYVKGIVNEKVVEEVRIRLDRIDIDGILESGYIEELIQDETYTPFPTIYNTERPDVVAAELLEGKVAILIDGTPNALIVPAPLIVFLHGAEDYYQRADFATLLRILRYISGFIALLGPSLYIAITTFHQEMLPTQLLISLAAQREGVPFPAFIEALMMEVTFEILREAGLRMPRAIGQAVSIVGTLVIGQAAVEAGIVSAAMVIVVSITAISNFTFPAYNMSIAVRMLRFPIMGLAASFGLFGIIVGIIALVLHLCSLRSFGIPYMTPFAPFIPADQKDTIFRLPQWALVSRPRLINQKNVVRKQSSPPKPKPRQ
ncbi:spore germination protein [Aneurinibacillus migulanus]|uniref:spore germination protein n=1 Tax=Aneurinibacillus migulanus TaxID=47500 RepID=UPI0005C3065E|nr:spore gernimation protein KA [Aneurinibacillus migulanus]CEH28532.1 GerA spore germination protein [Aneurinibacillus migulanus]